MLEFHLVDDRARHALQRGAAETPEAIRRGSKRAALLLGRKVAENIEKRRKWPKKSGPRLGSFFVLPEEAGSVFVLGRRSPVYAGIQEYGGTIRARRKPFLVFEYPPGSGEWHSVKEVHLPAKRYARDAVDEVRRGGALAELQVELHRVFAT